MTTAIIDVSYYIEVTDEVLNRYISEQVYPFWDKLGKALGLSSQFLDYNLVLSPDQDPDKRLRVILKKWRDTADDPSVSQLNRIYNQLGLAEYIKINNNS